jgi:hypothetical protein
MIERRTESRRRVLKSATITFAGQTIDCTIRNLSARGAGLDITVLAILPLSFNLAIMTDRVTRRCHLIWHRDRRAGIAFE